MLKKRKGGAMPKCKEDFYVCAKRVPEFPEVRLAVYPYRKKWVYNLAKNKDAKIIWLVFNSEYKPDDK